MPRTTKISTYTRLLEAAREAAYDAYAPYSGYQVGAAVLTFDNKIFTGCNVENVSYTLTIHAEVAAAVAAVAGGTIRRGESFGVSQSNIFKAVACVCLKAPEVWHCALCRQFLCEFGTGMDIVIPRADGTPLWKPLHRLVQYPFVPSHVVPCRHG